MTETMDWAHIAAWVPEGSRVLDLGLVPVNCCNT